MNFLTKEQILNADDLKSEIVNVPEWGGKIRIRTMTGIERDIFEESLFQIKGKDRVENFKNLRAKLVAMCIVDEQGKRLFAESDIEALGNKSAKALDRVFAVAQRINGIGVQEIEELTKN